MAYFLAFGEFQMAEESVPTVSISSKREPSPITTNEPSPIKTTTLLRISLSLPLLFQSLPFESLQFNLHAILFLSFLYFQLIKSTLSSDSLVFSMKAQSLVSGFCSNPTTPSIPNTKKSFFQAPTPPSSAYFSQSRKWVSFKIQHSAPQRVWYNKQNGVEEVKNGTSHGNDLEYGVRRKKLAVFVSGGGSNFRSVHKASLGGSVHGDIVVLVTNKRGCGGSLYARDNGIPVVLFPKTKDEPDGLAPNDLVAELRKFEVDFVLLAGYLKLIPVELIRAYPRSILNIHPSLLPAFGGKGYYGMKVHKAVIASGARYSGPTIHFVDEHYDTGRILAQSVVPVLAKDTAEELAARVLQEEHRLYVEVTTAVCEERIIWREDGVPLIQSKENPSEYR